MKVHGARGMRCAGKIIWAALVAFQIFPAHADTAQVTSFAAGATAYVQVSRANLRVRAEPNAPVLAVPVTNTRVRVLAETGDWCEVELLSGAETATQKNQHGFIACRSLSVQALSVREIYAQTSKTTDPKELLNLYSRAFWIAPSLGRWTAVGNAIERVIPDQDLGGDDYYRGPPPRKAVPEFEAMKERLAAGILVKPEDYIPSPGMPVDSPDKLGQYFAPYVKAALGRVRLPANKPSYFNIRNVPVVGDFNDAAVAIEMTDALSVSNGVAFRAVVTAPEHYGLNVGAPALAANSAWHLAHVAGPMGITMGIWDAGGLRITFEREAMLHGITARGLPVAMNITRIDLHIGADSACSYDHSTAQIDSSPVSGYAPPASALLMWAGAPMPGGINGKAQIKTRQFSGENETELVVSSEIDLNQDGIADFLIWQGRYQPQISAEGVWKAIFANVDGQWRLLDYYEDADCT